MGHIGIAIVFRRGVVVKERAVTLPPTLAAAAPAPEASLARESQIDSFRRGVPWAQTGPFPVLLHIHGGGWFNGSAKGELSLRAREHPFPVGRQDCIYAARWIATYGGAPDRPAVGGGSAGGNLSACTALALHGSEEGIDGGDLAGVSVRFRGAVLPFGVLDVPRWIVEPHYYAEAGPERERIVRWLHKHLK